MTERALIAVGCNAYDHMQALDGAEADAQHIYDALMRPEIGEYDPGYSRILLSPTSNALRTAMREVLFAGERLDTFTFFFAGHGGVKSGSFYMCLKDSRAEALSASGLSLSEFFLNLSEAAPAQSNIIIDACESGGLIADLGVLLKSSQIGDAGTPGITLLATSAQNQYSGETPEGGLGTSAILDCIEGREFIQDLTSALDLVEIGRRVSSRLRAIGDQTPVVWGLNLYGPPRFCRNPRFASDPTAPLRNVLQAWPSASDASIAEHYDRLWKAYDSASGEWNARSFADTVAPILEPLRTAPAPLVGFVDRLGAALLERATLSNDAYRPPQVGAALAGCLLRYTNDDLVARHAIVLQRTVGEAINAASSVLTESLSQGRYALLGIRGGLSDLFYLPERIAKVLGWAGLAGLLLPSGSQERALADHLFTHLLRVLLEQYGSSIVVMSDAQAPCWAIALARAAELGLQDDGAHLAGLLYSSLTDCGGHTAEVGISPDKVLSYLLMRHSGKFQAEPDLVARPSLTTTVLLKAAGLFGLEQVFDDDLWRLDSVTLGAYFTNNLEQFADEHMQGGENDVWQIGHDVFRVRDLDVSWPKTATQETPAPVLIAGAAMASLLYPDRVPWFLLTALSSDRDSAG
jgi:Caspase domain